MIDNLPLNPGAGDTYTSPKGVSYVFDGIKWKGNIVQTAVQGGAGPQGPQGPQGPKGDAAVIGPMNQKQYIPTNIVNITGVNQTVLTTTFTSKGNPVLVIANGDANPINGGTWCRLQWHRNGLPIGKPVHLESGMSNQNVTFAVIATDTPPAGTYTYTLQTVSVFGPNSFNFGETDPPVVNLIELAGAQGPQGPQGPGMSNTAVQNSITLGATVTAPVTGTRTVQRIESQSIGDKARITYKLGYNAGQAGSGEYLLTLPTGMAFNNTYHPPFTGPIWTGDVQNMAIYFTPAAGGIVIPGHWSNQIMVVPYDATRFRLSLSNNNSQTTYQFWHSGWYAASANTGLNIIFDIWATAAPAPTYATGGVRPPV